MTDRTAPADAYRHSLGRLQAWLAQRYKAADSADGPSLGRLQALLSQGNEAAGYEAAQTPARSMPRDARAVRKELKSIAGKLTALANRIEFGLAGTSLDNAKDAATSETAANWPTPQRLRFMADCVESVAKDIPDPRSRPFIEHGAMLYLHIRYRHGQGKPKQSLGDESVQEFAEMLQKASGAARGPDRALTLIKGALKGFDPFMPPDGLDEFI